MAASVSQVVCRKTQMNVTAANGCGTYRMDNFNPKKRYNQFRQARRKQNKFAVSEINHDEATGRHYKLEKFLRDCVMYLPKHEVEPVEKELVHDGEPAVTASKPRRSKHIKLPVLNECKGIFENAIIGRSAKKAENFAGVGATPEDRARLEEDIHALAKVGPDSELSFEMIQPTQQQQENVNRHPEEQVNNREVQNNQETVQVTPPAPDDESRAVEVAIPPVPIAEEMQIEYDQNRAFPEDVNQPSHRNYIITEENTTNPVDGNKPAEEFYQTEMCNSHFTDSGFKGSPTASPRKEEEKSDRAESYHCGCCRKTAPGRRKGSFFDTEAILKSNEAHWENHLGINEIFSRRKNLAEDPLKGGWLFEGASRGPSDFLGSTYPPPGPSEGIEIQSVGRQREFLANHGVDYCGSHRPTGSLKRRSRRMELNREVHYFRDDSVSTRKFPSEGLHHHLSPYNKYRYDRSLSPRKY